MQALLRHLPPCVSWQSSQALGFVESIPFPDYTPQQWQQGTVLRTPRGLLAANDVLEGRDAKRLTAKFDRSSPGPQTLEGSNTIHARHEIELQVVSLPPYSIQRRRRVKWLFKLRVKINGQSPQFPDVYRRSAEHEVQIHRRDRGPLKSRCRIPDQDCIEPVLCQELRSKSEEWRCVHSASYGRGASKTMRPPTIVSNTFASLICCEGIANRSRSIMTISASMPALSIPLLFSSPSAHALFSV
jgi:hypothetical protein